MYRYQVKPGHEDHVFGGDNVRNLGGGVVESESELNSPHLTVLEDQPAREQTQMTATPSPQLPPAAPPAQLPAAPVTPGLPAPTENQGDAS